MIQVWLSQLQFPTKCTADSGKKNKKKKKENSSLINVLNAQNSSLINVLNSQTQMQVYNFVMIHLHMSLGVFPSHVSQTIPQMPINASQLREEY